MNSLAFIPTDIVPGDQGQASKTRLAFGQIIQTTKDNGPSRRSTDFTDHLGRAIVIYRKSSSSGNEFTDEFQATYLQRCEDFRKLYFKLHRRQHGEMSLDEAQIPQNNFLLVNFSSNTNIMRSNAKELIGLRAVLQEAQSHRMKEKITIMISQWDGLTSNLEGFAKFLRNFSSLNLHLFVYHDAGEYEEFCAYDLLQEINDIGDPQKPRDATAASARSAILNMGGVGVNKGL